MKLRHPANIARYTRADRVAQLEDAITNLLGSGRFLVYQTAVIIVWIAVNVAGYFYHWDPYPFILLNLLFSTQAAYAAPLILMSQNRAAEHDRARAEHSYATTEQILATQQQILERLS
jgi:uncharacterized membrane protein